MLVSFSWRAPEPRPDSDPINNCYLIMLIVVAVAAALSESEKCNVSGVLEFGLGSVTGFIGQKFFINTTPAPFVPIRIEIEVDQSFFTLLLLS